MFAEGIGPGDDGGVVDGMKCDALGNVYVTGPGGYWVFDPSGDRIGVIDVPETTGNLNWGGPEWKTLYCTASTSLYRLEMQVVPVPNRAAPDQAGSNSHGAMTGAPTDRLDPKRCALVIQDLQNDTITEGGKFAGTGSADHARSQNVVANVQRLAATARARACRSSTSTCSSPAPRA